MARKTTIGKDVILEAALQMLIADGYESINIRTLAEKIGCSSQPLVWHFENMEGLRRALAVYARGYAVRKADPGN
ncbi:MAG: TetR family transcriptional regulator, partial [Clostridiales bacterium]|nr:TetR family transcriptional regulator [Clostridiales bacterium]